MSVYDSLRRWKVKNLVDHNHFSYSIIESVNQHHWFIPSTNNLIDPLVLIQSLKLLQIY